MGWPHAAADGWLAGWWGAGGWLLLERSAALCADAPTDPPPASKPCRCRCQNNSAPSFPGAPYPFPPSVPQNATQPDIYPGKYGPLPMFQGHRVVACEWQRWAMSPPVESWELIQEFIDITFEQGQKDAAAWCDANGYPAKAG